MGAAHNAGVWDINRHLFTHLGVPELLLFSKGILRSRMLGLVVIPPVISTRRDLSLPSKNGCLREAGRLLTS
jgi:hypothetical protein